MMSMKDTLNNWLPALLKEAELGNPDAMRILGFMYQEVFGVEKDQAKAKHHFNMEKSAPPFDLPDDHNKNTWAKTAIEV